MTAKISTGKRYKSVHGKKLPISWPLAFLKWKQSGKSLSTFIREDFPNICGYVTSITNAIRQFKKVEEALNSNDILVHPDTDAHSNKKQSARHINIVEQLNLYKGKIHLMVCKKRLMCGGIPRLVMAASLAGIKNLTAGRDWVVFVSEQFDRCKILHGDKFGWVLIQRVLYFDKMQHLARRIKGAVRILITPEELSKLLDGKPVRTIQRGVT